MRTRWFADPADGERLDGTLLRLVGAAWGMLDGLASPPVAPGTGRIDADASAVVLPHAAVPGCSLAVQVAGWSSSVGCGFAGTALLAVAAADPQTLLRADGSPRPRVAMASSRNPIARPNWGE
jgi:hypothetical protein